MCVVPGLEDVSAIRGKAAGLIEKVSLAGSVFREPTFFSPHCWTVSSMLRGTPMRFLTVMLLGASLSLAACGKDPGPKGDPGAQGPAGPQGAQGIQGVAGTQG